MNGLVMPIVLSYLSLPHELTHVCFPLPSLHSKASPGHVLGVTGPASLRHCCLPSPLVSGAQVVTEINQMGQSWPCCAVGITMNAGSD